ncbi:hypothetical protein HHK36_000845 [Tetracentron sinense]|uniref:Pre-mRNA-splicing factor 38 n=1 Tax=Tetracentron sinense TaxID=13715 RepID=A0A835DQD3_TETSI|nr:hypothetical protein HHK36_000845 [Tetracentron sinense]
MIEAKASCMRATRKTSYTKKKMMNGQCSKVDNKEKCSRTESLAGGATLGSTGVGKSDNQRRSLARTDEGVSVYVEMEIQTSGKPIDSLLEKVLCMNILSSDYFKELFRLKTYHEVIDEIYNQVDHVEPWMTGNCRGPSTAFCLLYKFFTMKLTVKQMHGLLKHSDSPYIRAIGFLYLRYTGDPKTIWGWFEPYVKDEEEFSPGSNGRMTTMGVYVRDLLLGQMGLKMEIKKELTTARLTSLEEAYKLALKIEAQLRHSTLKRTGVVVRGFSTSQNASSVPCSNYYFDTLFPRTPVPIMRQIVANLERMKLPTKHSGVTGETSRHGSDDTVRRPPSVKAALSVSFGQRAPHRASTRDSSPVRRTLPLPHDRNSSDVRRSPSNHRSQSCEFSDRDRDRDKEKDRDRRHEYDRRGSHEDRDYHKSNYVERDSRRREYERSSRESSRRREPSSHRSRSRSRSRSLQARSAYSDHNSSPFRDGIKDKTAPSSNLAKLKDLYGDTGNQRGDCGTERGPMYSSGEEVIRLGGSTWK